MKRYNVHIYREMRLVYQGIEADSLQAAAAIAREKPTGDADEIDDCEGETLSALVDVAGDTEYEQSEMIDFEGERVRKAAATMLGALRLAREALNAAPRFRVGNSDSYKIAAKADLAIAKAMAPVPPTLSQVVITEDEFDERFPLLANHLNPNAAWGSGEEGGCLFETCGQELEFVRQQDPRTVWTLADGDDGDQYLVSGFHFVNRVGYVVSTVPLPESMEIEVHLPMDDDDDAETDDPVEE